MAREEVSLSCTQCGCVWQAQASDVERVVKCPSCSWFNKVPARVKKRMELVCPHCEAEWNLPLKLRGKEYQCWQCHQTTLLSGLPELEIEKVSAPGEVSLGQREHEIILTISNEGTPAYITNVQVSFGHSGEDVSPFYTVTAAENNPSIVDHTEPIELLCMVSLDENTPTGETAVNIEVHGKDALDEAPLLAQAHIQWRVTPNRAFIVETEHDEEEAAGKAFWLRVWACLETGEIDTTFTGTKVLRFESSATDTPFGIAPVIPPQLELQFQEGVAVTPREFILYNAAETPQFMVFENIPGGPEGFSDVIRVLPDQLDRFLVKLSSHITNGFPVKGDNKIVAVDQFGNHIETFAEDVHLHSMGDLGKIVTKESEQAANVIPASVFYNGVADLTEIAMYYIDTSGKRLPYKETFRACWEKREGFSREIVIEPNPIDFALKGIDAPSQIEQGSHFEMSLLVSNATPYPLKIEDIDFSFFQEEDEEVVDERYRVVPKDTPEVLPPYEETVLQFETKLASNAPAGPNSLEVTITVFNEEKQLQGVDQGVYSWQIEPMGRTFVVLSETPLKVQAGEPVCLQLAAHLAGQLDPSYCGERALEIESDATASYLDEQPVIPQQLTVHFEQGKGELPAEIIFTNAGEQPYLKIKDPLAGGAKSNLITFSVLPGSVDFFALLLSPEQFNGLPFRGENQVIAMDAWGNFVEDFQEDCEIFPVSEQGKFFIQGQESYLLKGEFFEQGVANLTELEFTYITSKKLQFPHSEEIVIRWQEKESKSDPLLIQPGPGWLRIDKVVHPELIEPGHQTHKISLHVKNGGDHTLHIRNIAFQVLHQERDVTAHYSLLNPLENPRKIAAHQEVEISLGLIADSQAPLGENKVVLLVTTVSKELEQEVSEHFCWFLETKGRTFRASTTGELQETAGKAFGLKIAAYIEKEIDRSFHGKKILHFQTSAQLSPNGKKAVIPEILNIEFQEGEATTPPEFLIFNALEPAIIYIQEQEGDIQGQTPPIQIQPGELFDFTIELASQVRNHQCLSGENQITALDAYGNVMESFASPVTIVSPSVKNLLRDENNSPIFSLKGELFCHGKLDLSEQKIKVVYHGKDFPKQAFLQVSCNEIVSQSGEFEILPRPTKLAIGEILIPERVFPGQSYPVELEVENHGDLKVTISSCELTSATSQELQITPGQQPVLSPGHHRIALDMRLSSSLEPGLHHFPFTLKAQELDTTSEVTTEGELALQVDAPNRKIYLETENIQRETAGKPFALRLSIWLENELDTSYQGEREIHFALESTTEDMSLVKIPNKLSLHFQEGQACTAQDFTFFQVGKNFQITAHESISGGAQGISEKIEIQPGDFYQLAVKLSSPQINGKKFEGENYLQAQDEFGNSQTHFSGEISVFSYTRKGKVVVGEGELNQITAENFQQGRVNLARLGLTYINEPGEELPRQDRLIFSYQEKQYHSDTLVIEPLPSDLTLDEVSWPKRASQGETVSFSFDLSNTGDIPLEVVAYELTFWQEGENISEEFAWEFSDDNPSILGARERKQCTGLAHLDSDTLGELKVRLQVKAAVLDAEETQELLRQQHSQSLILTEKPREFFLETEHNNKEKAGEAFIVKIKAIQENQLDTSYEGKRELLFSYKASDNTGMPPHIPEKQRVHFKKGVAKTERNFVLTNAAAKVILFAEENNGQAKGVSDEITVVGGELKGLRVEFLSEEGGQEYNLSLLDSFNNVIEDNHVLDQDLRPGGILSGSRGTFYQILDVVGYGAMGKVYKATRLNDGLLVAIKTMLFSALSDINRFLLEALMLMRFNHPNIVKGYDLRQICSLESNKTQLKFFMVMEYLPGQSVKELLDVSENGMRSLEWATKIVLHSARALNYMWEHNTIHRDIKPENIQITEDNQIKMVDLGIAKAVGGLADITLTAKDTIVGSYPYISPERLKNSDVDFRADIYSLGATYYHMIIGIPPYLDGYKGKGGRDLRDYLIKVRTRRLPTPPSKIKESIPTNVSDLIMTMLQLKVNKRFQSGEELLEALERVYQELKQRPSHENSLA